MENVKDVEYCGILLKIRELSRKLSEALDKGHKIQQMVSTSSFMKLA